MLVLIPLGNPAAGLDPHSSLSNCKKSVCGSIDQRYNYPTGPEARTRRSDSSPLMRT